MPYVNGQYRLPSSPQPRANDPLSTALVRLEVYLWNVLACRHDRDELGAQEWQRKAQEAAEQVRARLDDREAPGAIALAARSAKRQFERDLEDEGKTYKEPSLLKGMPSTDWAQGWRAKKGREPIIR